MDPGLLPSLLLRCLGLRFRELGVQFSIVVTIYDTTIRISYHILGVGGFRV